jgi:ADP-heptose:LPS heptosyltransferase
MKIIQNQEKEPLVDVKFNIFKFNNRKKPTDKREIAIVSCLSEFGCEIIGCLFCLPRIFQERPGDYKIAVGWYGREYLYRHLVDEFWEIKEEYQWLRDYCRAFHHVSRNLKKLESALLQFGRVVPAENVGKVAVGNKCNSCSHFWGAIENVEDCPKCKGTDVVKSLFSDVENYRKTMTPMPPPSSAKMEEAEQYVKPNSVGIFARGRKTYGRNLQPEFYVKLINQLESMGYNPVWLGEKQCTQACPSPHIMDFSRSEKARDLELTCAILSKCEFTIQFWTASTRLAALMGIPYIIFESPMQIWGNGQEGFRLNLLKDLSPKKMVICHYNSVYEDHDTALKYVDQSIKELKEGNFKDIIGMVEDKRYMEYIRLTNKKRIGDD